MNDLIRIGSETAKSGFANEKAIANKFEDWKKDKEAQKWLKIMDYDLKKIKKVEAVVLHGHKTDIQIKVIVTLKKAISVQNLSIKKANSDADFNQIDKRWVKNYIEMWNIPTVIVSIFKRYTGELNPTIAHPKDKRRMFANEFSEVEQTQILKWLNQNKSLIVSDILKGRGQFSAEWMLVAQKTKTNSRWILKPMNFCLNHFGNGEIIITKKGNFKIGNIGMQRKGGDGGRKTANMLQFKVNPAELFDCD